MAGGCERGNRIRGEGFTGRTGGRRKTRPSIGCRAARFEEDPQPDLPDCFRNQAYVEKLVNGLKCLKNEGRQEEADAKPSSPAGGSAEETSAAEIAAVAAGDVVSHLPQFVGHAAMSSGR